jgi:glycerol kinase
MQAQADLLQVPVQVCAAADATALGAAALARLGTGAAGTLAEAVGQLPVEATIDPSISSDQAAERLAAFGSSLHAALPGRAAE